jgi:hypothetical protein
MFWPHFVMKSKQHEAFKLEAELLRLNTLVRQRRAQLARLEKCPQKDCECRTVWREVVEKNLAGQVSKIRRQVHTNGAKRRRVKARPLRAR